MTLCPSVAHEQPTSCPSVTDVDVLPTTRPPESNQAGEGVLEEAAAAVAQEEEEDDDEEDESEEEDSDDSESESDSSDNSDPEGQKLPSETLLQGRRSRATAGRRMAALLDDEEVG